jgi:HSP20 family protein
MAKEKKVPKQDKDLTVRQPLATRQFNDIFSQPFFPSLWRGFAGEEGIWAPAIHVLEKENKFIAKVELPGVHDEDVSVSIVGDMLVVEGEKEAESEVKQKGYSYSETSYGSFSRSIAIPSVVDIDKITANFDKGVLEIDLPKSAQVKPKKVSVTTRKKPKTVVKERTTPSVGEKKKLGNKETE